MMQFCTFVVPYALVQYYPLMVVLGRSDRWWDSLLPLAAMLFLVPCWGLWKIGVKHYQSAGS